MTPTTRVCFQFLFVRETKHQIGMALCSFRFFIVIALLAIVSLTIYASMLPMNSPVPVSVGKEHTTYFYGRQAYLVTVSDHEESVTPVSSNKSITLLETEFSVTKLQRTKLVNITALKPSCLDRYHQHTEYSKVKNL